MCKRMKEEFCTILFLPLLSGTEALPASAFYYIIGLKNMLTDSTGFLFSFFSFFFILFFLIDCFKVPLTQEALAL